MPKKFPLLTTIALLSLFTVSCGGDRATSNASSTPAPQQPASPTPVASTSPAPLPSASAPATPQANLTPQNESTAPTGTHAGTNDNTYLVQTQDGSALNVRADISTNAAIVGSIPNGTQVLMHLSDRSGEWLEVSAPGNLRGWVSAQYLVDRKGNVASPSLSAAAQRLANSTQANSTQDNTQDNPANESPSENASGKTYRVKTVDGTALNLRVSPQLGTDVVAKLPNGAIVTEVGTVGQWTEVVTSDGLRGYVATNYLVDN
ncbi:SH3 domain-containing protein [Alkalinema sp. FACHB-956]|uniref:SH3 domain-containing protein n=1 Tax=Alkalinema sp. FACHB-956 TaxID=2692768 RepID=UPI001681F5CE|nr:SH3 domain-containing protein [Alkalinema sp. FACHB-956]MBD2328463.1 SH3 domain-containing protein [Alkalinema sp. FACHB-956]